MQITTFWKFTDAEKQAIQSLLAKGHAEEARNDAFAIIDPDSFYALFSAAEVAILRRWLAINPKEINYKLPYIGVPLTTPAVVAIREQTYTDIENKLVTIPCQYLPDVVLRAWEQMNEALAADTGKQLRVLYGYRTPARQAFLFFDILVYYDFDFQKAMGRVCLPDYSEHVCPQRQAIDFQTQHATPSDQFDTTIEYAWLKKHAESYGFHESYAKDNGLGMMYEPWHWHYEAPAHGENAGVQ